MGLIDYLKGQFLEIIEWTDDSRDTLSYRFPDEDKEIIATLADQRHLENLSGLSEETIALLYDWYCCGFSSPSGSLMP